MKVTLINPPHLTREDRLETFFSPPPIGLAYLASTLRSHQFDVQVIDGYGESPMSYSDLKEGHEKLLINGLTLEQLLCRIDPNAQVIGVSCMFTSLWSFHRKILTQIIERFPNTLIVVGGEHVTAEYKSILKDFEDIICVLGEGEETISEVCKKVANGETNQLHTVNGLAFKKSSHVVLTEARQRIKKLDTLPLPAWDLLPVENYIPNGISVVNKRTLPLISSRGCPYRCRFCSAPRTWGTETYLREPGEIIKEMKKFKELYNIDHFEFMDLVGSFNKKWTLRFCDEMIASNLDVTLIYAPGTRSEVLTKDVLVKMKAAGFVKVLYAADSTSAEESRRILKNVNFEKMLISIKNCVDTGMVARLVLMVGYPGMKKRELWKGLIFAYRAVWIGVNDLPVNNFVPYSGSDFHDQLVERGHNFEIEGSTNSFLGYVDSYSEHIPSWLLSVYRSFLIVSCVILQFMLRPWRLFQSFLRLKNNSPITSTENVIYFKLRQITGLKQF